MDLSRPERLTQTSTPRSKSTVVGSGDVLLVVDAIDEFRHPDGRTLLASFRVKSGAMRQALNFARSASVPIIYANDTKGIWDGDRHRLIAAAVHRGLDDDVVE